MPNSIQRPAVQPVPPAPRLFPHLIPFGHMSDTKDTIDEKPLSNQMLHVDSLTLKVTDSSKPGLVHYYLLSFNKDELNMLC